MTMTTSVLRLCARVASACLTRSKAWSDVECEEIIMRIKKDKF